MPKPSASSTATPPAAPKPPASEPTPPEAVAPAAPAPAAPKRPLAVVVRNNRPRILHLDLARNEEDGSRLKYFYPGTNMLTASEFEALQKDPGFKDFLTAPKGRSAALTIIHRAMDPASQLASLLDAIPEMVDPPYLEQLTQHTHRGIATAAKRRLEEFQKARQKKADMPGAEEELPAEGSEQVTDADALVTE